MAKKIRKIQQTNPILLELSKVSNEYNESTEDTYSCEYINNATKEIYDEEETVIGTWIDGKPIYRKVISINHNTVGEIGYDNNFNIDFLVNYYGRCVVQNQSIEQMGYRPFPFTNGSQIFNISRHKSNILYTTSSFTGCSATIVLEYTKTTD